MSKTNNETIVQGTKGFPTINANFFQEIADALNNMPITFNSLSEGNVHDDYVILYDDDNDEDEGEATRFEIKLTGADGDIQYAVTNYTHSLDESYFNEMIEKLNNFLEEETGYELVYDITYTTPALSAKGINDDVLDAELHALGKQLTDEGYGIDHSYQTLFIDGTFHVTAKKSLRKSITFTLDVDDYILFEAEASNLITSTVGYLIKVNNTSGRKFDIEFMVNFGCN